MTNLELPEFEKYFLKEQCARFDDETRILSGGFSFKPWFSILRAQGPEIIPVLYEELATNTDAGFWWRVELIDNITQDYGEPAIPYKEEHAGQLKHVAETLFSWGQNHGFTEYEQLAQESITKR